MQGKWTGRPKKLNEPPPEEIAFEFVFFFFCLLFRSVQQVHPVRLPMPVAGIRKATACRALFAELLCA
jgi:hypothetical protein